MSTFEKRAGKLNGIKEGKVISWMSKIMQIGEFKLSET